MASSPVQHPAPPQHPRRPCAPRPPRRSFRYRPRVAWLLALLLALAVLAAPNAGAEAGPGWDRLQLPGGSYALRFVPRDVELPAPTVLFLHGAGGTPGPYQGFLGPAAEAAGLVVVAARSATDLGWGFEDDNRILVEALEAAEAEGSADLDRLTIAGHSSGAAYAYLLTYGGGFPARAVFTLASPFYPLVGPPAILPPPPIRMYYGRNDPNFTGGSYQRLADQWDRLGVPWEADLATGYGHSSWPPSSFDAGIAFLASHSGVPSGDCTPSDTVLCLLDGRYRVAVEWERSPGDTGPGRVVDGFSGAGGDTSGLFWFFRPTNWELMVKVLDGCGVNGHRWVFSAATTNLAYTLRVTDTETLEEWRHDNLAGEPAPAVTATDAFLCTPEDKG